MKLKSRDEIKEIAERLRKEGKKIVFTNGCFDVIHPGHIKSFRFAKSLGDVLIVGLNSDSSVRRIKGEKRPIIDVKGRSEILSAIEYIDYIVIFDEDTPENLIKVIKPDVLVKGEDWRGKKVVGADFVQSYGGKVEFCPLYPEYSTTKIIEKILEKYGKI